MTILGIYDLLLLINNEYIFQVNTLFKDQLSESVVAMEALTNAGGMNEKYTVLVTQNHV